VVIEAAENEAVTVGQQSVAPDVSEIARFARTQTGPATAADYGMTGAVSLMRVVLRRFLHRGRGK